MSETYVTDIYSLCVKDKLRVTISDKTLSCYFADTEKSIRDSISALYIKTVSP